MTALLSAYEESERLNREFFARRRRADAEAAMKSAAIAWAIEIHAGMPELHAGNKLLAVVDRYLAVQREEDGQ